jgi:hypothetical protein
LAIRVACKLKAKDIPPPPERPRLWVAASLSGKAAVL